MAGLKPDYRPSLFSKMCAEISHKFFDADINLQKLIMNSASQAER